MSDSNKSFGDFNIHIASVTWHFLSFGDVLYSLTHLICPISLKHVWREKDQQLGLQYINCTGDNKNANYTVLCKGLEGPLEKIAALMYAKHSLCNFDKLESQYLV